MWFHFYGRCVSGYYLNLMKRAYDVEHFSCTNPDMSVLFVSGAEDPCLINVRHFAKTVRAMRRAGYKDVKGKLYPGMRHEILNEIGREQVYHDIAVYMRKKGLLSGCIKWRDIRLNYNDL